MYEHEIEDTMQNKDIIKNLNLRYINLATTIFVLIKY